LAQLVELKLAITSVLQEYVYDTELDAPDVIDEMATEIMDRVTVVNPYAEGYNLLMEYWDSIPDDDKVELDEKLRKLGI